MLEKIYHFVCWTEDAVDIDIEAESKEEAEKKLNEMYDKDEIRWEKATTIDGGHYLAAVESKKEG